MLKAIIIDDEPDCVPGVSEEEIDEGEYNELPPWFSFLNCFCFLAAGLERSLGTQYVHLEEWFFPLQSNAHP